MKRSSTRATRPSGSSSWTQGWDRPRERTSSNNPHQWSKSLKLGILIKSCPYKLSPMMSGQSLHGRDATNCNKPGQMQPRSASAGARLLRTSRWGGNQILMMCPPWKAILNIDWPYHCIVGMSQEIKAKKCETKKKQKAITAQKNFCKKVSFASEHRMT